MSLMAKKMNNKFYFLKQKIKRVEVTTRRECMHCYEYDYACHVHYAFGLVIFLMLKI